MFKVSCVNQILITEAHICYFRGGSTILGNKMKSLPFNFYAEIVSSEFSQDSTLHLDFSFENSNYNSILYLDKDDKAQIEFNFGAKVNLQLRQQIIRISGDR
jgi:hypothetical protein